MQSFFIAALLLVAVAHAQPGQQHGWAKDERARPPGRGNEPGQDRGRPNNGPGLSGQGKEPGQDRGRPNNGPGLSGQGKEPGQDRGRPNDRPGLSGQGKEPGKDRGRPNNGPGLSGRGNETGQHRGQPNRVGSSGNSPQALRKGGDFGKPQGPRHEHKLVFSPAFTVNNVTLQNATNIPLKEGENIFVMPQGGRHGPRGPHNGQYVKLTYNHTVPTIFTIEFGLFKPREAAALHREEDSDDGDDWEPWV